MSVIQTLSLRYKEYGVAAVVLTWARVVSFASPRFSL